MKTRSKQTKQGKKKTNSDKVSPATLTPRDVGIVLDEKSLSKVGTKGIIYCMVPSWSRTTVLFGYGKTGKQTLVEWCTGFPNGLKLLGWTGYDKRHVKNKYFEFMERLSESDFCNSIVNGCPWKDINTPTWRKISDVKALGLLWEEYFPRGTILVKDRTEFPLNSRTTKALLSGSYKGAPKGVDFMSIPKSIRDSVGLYCIVPSWSRGLVKTGVAKESFQERFKKYCKQFPYGFTVLGLATFDKALSKNELQDAETNLFDCIGCSKTLCRISPECAGRTQITEWYNLSNKKSQDYFIEKFTQCPSDSDGFQKVFVYSS